MLSQKNSPFPCPTHRLGVLKVFSSISSGEFQNSSGKIDNHFFLGLPIKGNRSYLISSMNKHVVLMCNLLSNPITSIENDSKQQPKGGASVRAALYARVSTEEQTEGYSIDAQKRAFQRLCEERGWVPHHEYIEAGKSAHTDDTRKRPVFKQAIDDALSGGYGVLVVHKIDRLSRKLKITLEYFEKLGKNGIGFVSIENNIDYSTPEGKLMLMMQGGLAEFYSENLSRETKKGWDTGAGPRNKADRNQWKYHDLAQL